MEEEPKTKQERKAMAIKITTGVGGIGGIVFLGGALVAATLVSAFAYKRRTSKTGHQAKSSPDNDVTVHLTSPPPESVTDLPNDLEMMMKSSKDHQIIRGLTFLLPADSALPFLPNNSSKDTAAETGVTRIEPAQVLVLDDEKAKVEVNSAGYQEMVLSETHDESTPLFDDSITKEEYPLSLLSEASGLELESNKNVENFVGSDQQTISSSDGLVPESNGYGVRSRLSLPLVDTPLHSQPESTDKNAYSSKQKLPDFVEAVELLVEEGCEVKCLLPVLDSANLSVSESVNEDDFSKENTPVSVEAVELLEEECEIMNKDKCSAEPFPVFAEAVGLQVEDSEVKSEIMNKDEFSTEPFPVFAEAVGLQVEDGEVKSLLPLLDNFSMDNSSVLDQALELLEEDSEESNAGTGYRDDIEVKKELDLCDGTVQEMIVEDLVHEIAQEDQVTDGKETIENHDEEKLDSEPLVGAVEVKKGESFDVVCDSNGVGEEKLEVRMMGEEAEEIKENGNGIVGVDQIIAEVNEEVKSIGIGEKDDVGETNVDKCEKTSKEALSDQVAEEEEEERVEVSENEDEDEETESNSVQDEIQSDVLGISSFTEEALELSEVATEVVCLDPVKLEVEDRAGMRLIEEEENEECDDFQGDIIATKCEGESTEIANADEVLESLLEDSEQKELDVDNTEDEPMETADADELVKSLENGEKDNVSRSLIIEQEFSETMVDDGVLVLDSGEVPPSAQVESSDEESESESESEEEESSEGTEDLSTESNYDAVWPAETIQQLSFKLDEMKTDDENVDITGSYAREVVGNQRWMEEPWKVKSWVWSMFAVVWCLCHWYLDLPYVNVMFVTLAISIALLFGSPKS